jgi:hypothetical protein
LTNFTIALCCIFTKQIFVSAAKGPKFWPQNTKGAEKNCGGPGKSGAEFFADISKKGRIFLWFGFALKLIYISAENCNFPLMYSIFPYHFAY